MSELDGLFQTAMQSHVAGEFTAAAGGYAKVLMKDPTHADAWHLAGLLAHQNGRSADGLKQIQMAIELNSTNPEYFSNLAAIFNKLKRPEEALKAAEQALAIDSSFGPADFQKGIACSLLDRMDDALQSLEQSYESGFANQAVLREIGETKQFLGDMQGALKDIEDSIAMNPDHPTGYFQLSTFVRAGQYSYSDSQLAKIRELIEKTTDNLDIQNRLHIAMAVHLEKAKNYVDAFDHFQIAKSVKRTHVETEGIQFSKTNRQQVDNDIIEFFSEELFEKFRHSGNWSRRPIFIVGMPRSGTTLVQQILDAHPLVVGAGELTAINDLMYARFGDGGQNRLRQMFPSTDELWLRQSAVNYLQTLDEKVAVLRSGSSDDSPEPIHVVDKMPDNYLQMGFIRLMFPKAAIVNCQRDPRDICLSCFCQSFESKRLEMATSSFDNLACIYRNYARVMNHWQSVLPGGFHQIVYEELLENPEQQISKLLQHLQLDWDDACLKFHTSKSHVRTASVNQVRQPFYKSSSQKWRRYEKQLEPLSHLLTDEIKEFEELRSKCSSSAN